jgi:DNA modification methylase
VSHDPYLADPDFTLYHGDVRTILPHLPAESVDCAATSPPFYGLRDYGVDGQIGLESTPDEWAAELVGVFREVRRILRPHGTLWIECGDSYAQYDGQGNRDEPREPGMHGAFQLTARLSEIAEGRADRHALPAGYKRKDLIGGPWLLAFALRADGWYLRQAIIWHKPNAMPESVRDRCTTAHSYVFLLSKSPRYWFDADAISEPAEWARWGDQTTPKHNGTDTAAGWIKPKSVEELRGLYGRSASGNRKGQAGDVLINGGGWACVPVPAVKNARSVWSIPTQGYPGAHFATWPEQLVERIVKAGCPEGGTILDPFMGSGTTALVARRQGRSSIGVELNAEYAAMAAERCRQLSLLAAR